VRTVGVARALVCGLLVATTALVTAPASAAGPTIRAFTASATSVPASGGKVTLKVRTTGARSCTLKSSVPIRSLPTTVDCRDGRWTKRVKIPAARNGGATRVVLTLVARSGSEVARKKVVVVRAAPTTPPPPPAVPTIAGFGANPSAVPATGGGVTLTASVSGASSCRLVPPADLGAPTVVACASGFADRMVAIPANPSTSPRTLTFTLEATSGGGTATRSVSVEQPGAVQPTVTGFSATPDTVPVTGGVVTLVWSVSGAATCTLTLPAALGGQSSSCAGSTSKQVVVPSNEASTSPRALTFEISATSAAGSSTSTVGVQQDGAVLPSIASFEVSPDNVPIGGGFVTFTWDVLDASSCTFTLPAALGGGTSSCAGTTSREVFIPDNLASTDPRSLSFQISATSAAGTVNAFASVSQPGAVTPTISSFTATPDNGPASAFTVTFSWTISNASACTLTLPAALGGTTSSCTGTSGRQVLVGANPGGPRALTFQLKAISAAGSVIQDVTVQQQGG
jgi:hypothetical protein